MQILTNLDLNKNELQNVRLQNLAIPPTSPKEGQIYYNTIDQQAYQYKGSEKGWEPIGAPYTLPIASQDQLGGVKIGSGLLIDADTGILSATGGGVADAVAWENITSKPFDGIDLSEMEIIGIEPKRKLGVKAIDKNKVTGLNEALEEKISGIKKNGSLVSPIEGIVDVEVPTKVGDLTNDKNYITSTQLEEAIKSVGTVFDFKGSKKTAAEVKLLTGAIGDVWYAEDEKVGYIWINDSTSEGRWEQLGPTIDLTGYITKEGLLTGTGESTDNAMTQKAVTDALNTKATKEEVSAVPVVKIKEGTIASSSTTVTVAYSGKLLGTFAKNAEGEEVLLDTVIGPSTITFSTAKAPGSNVTCTVVYI